MTCLQVQPELRGRPEIRAQPECRIRRDGPAAPDDIVDPHRRHPQLPRQAVSGQAERLQEVVLEHVSRVYGAEATCRGTALPRPLNLTCVAYRLHSHNARRGYDRVPELDRRS